jgi:hypothetical protein
MKMYLVVYDFCFDLMVLTLLLLSFLGHAEGKRGNRGYARRSYSRANPEVTKIVKEKQCASDGFDDTGVVHDRTSDDVEEGERVEV